MSDYTDPAPFLLASGGRSARPAVDEEYVYDPREEGQRLSPRQVRRIQVDQARTLLASARHQIEEAGRIIEAIDAEDVDAFAIAAAEMSVRVAIRDLPSAP